MYEMGVVVAGRRAAKSARGGAAIAEPSPSASTSTEPDSSVSQGPSHSRRRLGEILVDQWLVDEAQLYEALKNQSGSGKSIGSLLIELGALTERGLASALAEQVGLPLADLRTEIPDPSAVEAMPAEVARLFLALPLRFTEGGALLIAVADPSEPNRRAVADAIGREVRMCVAAPSEVQLAIDSVYRATAGVGAQVEAFQANAIARRPAVEGRLVDVGGDDAPVVQVVTMILTQALRDRASDIHIEPRDDGVRVRNRIDGALHEALNLPVEMGPALVSRIKIMAGMNIVERRRPQDGQIATELDGRPLDIRVATTGTIWGEKAVLRLLDKSRPLYRVSDLGMPADTHTTYSRLIHAPFGMVICAGPTGSGKTTTLYASVTEIDTPDRNITTIEDPVEYVFPSINQIQINETAGVSFATGLKSILRQDPDIILVGEIRDAETARIAVQSALTGHLVLSSLHATDAVSALYRFLDMGIESFLVASSVIGVVGQRLVRQICMYCKVAYRPTGEELAFYEDAGGRPKREFFTGAGCNFCAQTGYSSRIGVYELMRVTDEMRRLIVRGRASHEEMAELAVAQGMRPLRDEAISLVQNDVTTIAEVVRTVYLV